MDVGSAPAARSSVSLVFRRRDHSPTAAMRPPPNAAGKEHAQRFNRKVDAERWLGGRTGGHRPRYLRQPSGGKDDPRRLRGRMDAAHGSDVASLNSGQHRQQPRPPRLARPRSPAIGVSPQVRRGGSVRAGARPRDGWPPSTSTLTNSLQRRRGRPDRAQSGQPSSPAEAGTLQRPAGRARDVERIHAALPDWMAVAVPLGIGAGLRQGERAASRSTAWTSCAELRIDRQLVSRFVPPPVLASPKTPSSHRTTPLPVSSSTPLRTTYAGFPLAPVSSCCAPPPAWRSTPTASGTSGVEPLGPPASPVSVTRPPSHLRLDRVVTRRLGEGGRRLAGPWEPGHHPEHLRPPDAGG